MTLVDANHCPGMPLEEYIALASAAEGSWVQFLRGKVTAMCSAPASVELCFDRVQCHCRSRAVPFQAA